MAASPAPSATRSAGTDPQSDWQAAAAEAGWTWLATLMRAWPA